MIAVIDDDESVLKSMARLLKASGYQSALYWSAEDFLAEPLHSRFDCLIVDLQLGGMSGIDLQEQLTSASVSIPMILMTASDEIEIDRLALQCRGAALMRKSDPGEALLAVLGRRIDRVPVPEKWLSRLWHRPMLKPL